MESELAEILKPEWPVRQATPSATPYINGTANKEAIDQANHDAIPIDQPWRSPDMPTSAQSR